MIERIAAHPNAVNLAGAQPVFGLKCEFPFQAADLLAWLHRRAYDGRPVRREYDQVFSPLVGERSNQWGGLLADHIRKFCRQFRVPRRGEVRMWNGPGWDE